MSGIEIFGFISSVIVLASFMMEKIYMLRYVTILGSSMFVIYGSILGLKPIIIVNLLIVLINLYKLFEEHVKTRRNETRK